MRFIGNNTLDEWMLYNRQFQGNILYTLVTLEATSIPSIHPTNIYSLTSLNSTSNHIISCTDTIINNYVRPVVYLSIYTVRASNIISIDLFKCRSKHLPNFAIYLMFIFDILTLFFISSRHRLEKVRWTYPETSAHYWHTSQFGEQCIGWPWMKINKFL